MCDTKHHSVPGLFFKCLLHSYEALDQKAASWTSAMSQQSTFHGAKSPCLSFNVRVMSFRQQEYIVFILERATLVAVKCSESWKRQAHLHCSSSFLFTSLSSLCHLTFLSHLSFVYKLFVQLFSSGLESKASHHLLIHCPRHGGHHGPPQRPWNRPSEEALESLFLR